MGCSSSITLYLCMIDDASVVIRKIVCTTETIGAELSLYIRIYVCKQKLAVEYL